MRAHNSLSSMPRLQSDRSTMKRTPVTSRPATSIRGSSCQAAAFVQAAAMGDVKTIQRMVCHDVISNVNCLYRHQSALYVASQAGHLAVVQAILQQAGKGEGGVDVNVLLLSNTDSEMAAAKSSISSPVALSVPAIMDHHRAEFGETALYVACQQGHASIMQALLRAGADVHCLCTSRQQNALHVACMAGQTKSYCRIVESLLRAGADVNGRRGTPPPVETASSPSTHYGETPLYLACQAGNVSVVRILLRASADIDALCTPRQESALHAACLARPCTQSHCAIVQILLLAGVTTLRTNTDGLTALRLLQSQQSQADQSELQQQEQQRPRQDDAEKESYEYQQEIHFILKRAETTALDSPISEALTRVNSEGISVKRPASRNNWYSLTLKKQRALIFLHSSIRADADMEQILNVYIQNPWIKVHATNRPQDDETTALHLAAERGRVDIVQWLLSLDLDTDEINAILVEDTFRRTPLIAALNLVPDKVKDVTEDDQFSIFEMILSRMVAHQDDVTASDSWLNRIDSCGLSPIDYAVVNGSIRIVHDLLNWKPHLDRINYSPLKRIFKSGELTIQQKVDILQCLAEHPYGYGPEAWQVTDDGGHTVLDMALKRHSEIDVPLLDYLLSVVPFGPKTGLIIHRLVCRGVSQLLLAALVSSRHAIHVKELRRYKGKTLLHEAILCNRPHAIFPLVQVIDVNCQDDDGRTPLHYAVQKKQLLRLLLRLKDPGQVVDVNIQDCHGKSALHYAVQGKDNIAVDMLLNLKVPDLHREININLQDHDGNMALHYAILKRDILCTEMLCLAKANFSIVNRKGETPLLLACHLDDCRNDEEKEYQLSIIFLLFRFGVAFDEIANMIGTSHVLEY